jgi:predicted TIM-barrel fold metal-dependent hydrolase
MRMQQALRGLAALAVFACGVAGGQASLPIFDAHLHYNDEAREPFPIPAVLARFRESGVAAILATSRPNDGTRALLAAVQASPATAPAVVPFIRPYRNHADRQTWFNDPEIYALIEAELRRGIGYRGIGEFHVFGAADAGTPWVAKIVALAVAGDLWLHAHCDDAALEAILAHNPSVKVIWAHSGFSTPPEKIAAYFARYPALVGELSYRYDVTRDGRLAPSWRELFQKYPDRFVLGSDTWVNERWMQYGDIIRYYRGWLAELPPQVARRIAYDNGARMFGLPRPDPPAGAVRKE